MGAVSVGSIVKCRGREWVVLPSEDEELYLLRPLAGTEQEVIGIHYRLHDLGLDRIDPASPQHHRRFKLATTSAWNCCLTQLGSPFAMAQDRSGHWGT